MATLKQYFDTDLNRVLSVKQPFIYGSKDEAVEVICRIHYDFDSNTFYVSYYVPLSRSVSQLCLTLIQDLEWAEKIRKETIVQSGVTLGDYPIISTDLHFSGRIFIYSENNLRQDDIQRLKEVGGKLGRSVHFRDPEYAVERSKLEKPLAFISHDFRDKDEIARPLALRLITMMCPVWYDEYSLKLGSSLRQSIETGIKECKSCILILTPNFLSNTGWTKVEFNSVFTREILERTNVVLPIWHGVTSRDVYEYSPSLADKVAIDWSKGIDEVSRRIYRSVTS